VKIRITGNRAFVSIAIILICVYGYFAFFEISAPIQYDPLGPEGWPRFLAMAALLLCVSILRDADERSAMRFDGTSRQVLIAAAMLWVYASVFEWLGFALATSLFCAGLAGLMGARGSRAILFGVLLGVGQYVIAVHLLGLNLPIGEIFVAGNGPS
jgi:putative tricarboxylic transport membrane protein